MFACASGCLTRSKPVASRGTPTTPDLRDCFRVNPGRTTLSLVAQRSSASAAALEGSSGAEYADGDDRCDEHDRKATDDRVVGNPSGGRQFAFVGD